MEYSNEHYINIEISNDIFVLVQTGAGYGKLMIAQRGARMTSALG
jgi:hypothetical protein